MLTSATLALYSASAAALSFPARDLAFASAASSLAPFAFENKSATAPSKRATFSDAHVE